MEIRLFGIEKKRERKKEEEGSAGEEKSMIANERNWIALMGAG